MIPIKYHCTIQNYDQSSSLCTPDTLFTRHKHRPQIAEKKNNTLFLSLAQDNIQAGGTHHNPILAPQIAFTSKLTSLDTPIHVP